MAVVRETQGLHRIPLGGVNAFLLDAGDGGLALVDTGLPGSAPGVVDALTSMGHGLGEIRHILVTHCHADHSGSLADLKAMTGARVFMHFRDASLVARGRAKRRLVRTPGLINRIRFPAFSRFPSEIAPVVVDETVHDGDEIPVAGGIRVIHTPGHTEGHVAFLAKRHKVVFVGDAAANIAGFLGLMPAYEHLRQGVYSLRHLSRHDFDVACFGHGLSIRAGAAKQFRRMWGGRRYSRYKGAGPA